MKPFLIILFLSLHIIVSAQHTHSESSDNDTLYNMLLKKHLLGAYIEVNGTQKHIKGKKINDTLYMYINKKYKKVLVSELQNHLQYLNDSLIQTGYLFNRIQPDSIKVKEHHLHIFYQLQKNNLNRIDSLVVIPGRNFPKNIWRNLNKFIAGHTINSQNINTVTNFIDNETGFKLATEPVINFYKGQKVLVIKLQKTPKNSIDGMIGFNYNAEKSKLQLEAHIKTSFFNLINSGEQIYLEWQRQNTVQLLQFNTVFPYVKGSNFVLSNFFSSKRKDTTGFSISNLSRLRYRFKRQSLGVNFTYQFSDEQNHTINNHFIGIYYQKIFKTKKENWIINFQSRFDLKINEPDKKIIYAQIRSTENISKRFVLSHNMQIYNTNDTNTISPTIEQTGMFRKASNIDNNFRKIISFKNEIIYRTKHSDFYLIGDYIDAHNCQKFTTGYVNTGVGMGFYKKNQRLIIEIIKPIQMSYYTDFQDIYINVKQVIRF